MEYQIWHIKECEQQFGYDENAISVHHHRSLWAKKVVLQYVNLPLKIVYDDCGKPYFDNVSAIKFSISHTSDYIAAAFDSNDIGIDIEHIRTGKEEIVKRFFTPEERHYLFALQSSEFNYAFTKLWTLKEAFAKCTGSGINGSFAKQTIDLQTLKVEGRETEFDLTSFFEDEKKLFVSICSKKI